ncbi:MAG TPA: hypothetical protein DGT21_06065, partial [Armatimonadetes bacterium]|nr:hypothetical protein [Armatimonadota bacterium]
CSAIAADHARAEFALRNASGKLALPCRVEHLTETSPGADRWLSTIRMSTRDLATGNHQLQAVARDLQSGAILAEDTFGFMYPGDAPAWLGSQEGISEEVLPPFTPLEATDDDGVHAISCWGRSYQFGRDPFISQIISQSQHLLAGPIRLQATIDGEKQSWTCRELNASTDSPAKHTLEQELESDAAGVNVSTSIEYDGFIRQDWELTVADGGQVQALTYEIPLNPETARYSYWWPQPRSGALSADLATEFKPIVWLGSEDVGLQWVCESDEQWHSADPERAIEIIRGEDEVLLRLNLVSQTMDLAAGEMLTYSFGLHATPVKPMERDAWDYRIVRHPWYGQSFQLHEKKVGETPALEYFRAKGVRALINWRMWDAFAYVAPLGHEEEFRELVKTWHQYGIGVVPYTVSFLLSENAPEALFFREEMTRAPLTEFPIIFPGLPRETDYHTCHNSIWSDYVADGIARLIDEYDVDGIYLDTTSTPWPCNSELHGCGYPRPDGTRAPTYPVFAARTNLKRLYTVVKSRKPEGIIDLHVYDCMLAPALSFVTTYWNGEQLPKGHAFKPEVLPLDRFRTEFMGYNWGPPADLLYYCLGDYEKSVAIALLHDVPVRSEKLPDLEVQSALWKLRERFGVQQAEWMPYWRNSDVVTVTPEDCYASLFNHLDGRALAYVSNLSREDANVTVWLDLNALGLKPPLTAADGLTGETLGMADGTLTVKMPSQSFRTVWVEGKR